MSTTLHDLCQEGQRLLTQMEYAQAERVLAEAEQEAYALRDYDTLSRLYLPLQEARRQRRLRCGEGLVCLNLLAEGPDDHVDGRHVVENYPHGQLLVAGWGTIAPAVEVRHLQVEHALYVETFLGAVYPVQGGQRVIVIAPTEDATLPEPEERPIEALRPLLPQHSLVLKPQDLPADCVRGNSQTYGLALSLWERLHAPFLAAADAMSDPVEKIDAYRLTIAVDYACELAHQSLSDAARKAMRNDGLRMQNE